MPVTDKRPYTSSELQDINNERLTGEVQQPQMSSMQSVSSPSMPTRIPSAWRQRVDEIKAGIQPSADITDYTEEAVRSGWGNSRYDTTNPYMPGQDLEEARALEQTSFNKIVSGLAKGGVTAATTAVNTVAGTVFGTGSSLFELLSRVAGEGNGQPGMMGIVDAGVNNWLSQRMLNLQKASEEWFPNYRTEQERSEKYQREWYRHMGSANFIGDSLLKNFGFTVGAMAGGMAWSRLLNKSLYKKLSGDILKASVLAAEGDTQAYTEVKRIADAIRAGNIQTIDPNRLATTIENVAKQINKADALLQLYGSAIGAMGEGTSEGLMARQEFDDDVNALIASNQQRDLQRAREDILEERDRRFVSFRQAYDRQGNVISVPYLTEEGEREAYRRQADVEQKYRRIRELADQEGQRLATTTFLLNLPILTTSNLIQFGRMFSGGWKTAKNTASQVSGGIRRQAAQKGAESVAKRSGLAWLADYGGKGNVWTKSILNSFKVAGSESFEEMAQGTISSGAKHVGTERILAAFNNDGYDVDAIDSVREWFASMSQGGSEYLGDIKNWQEGAMGALTGLLGIPGKGYFKGQRGGLAQAIHDAREEVGLSRKAAETLNNLVNSDDFQNRWHSYIRHLSYDNKMQDAVIKNDQYAWQNNNDKQLISDVMAFADAGRLEDLHQIVSAYGNMTAADAGQLREALKQSDTFTPIAPDLDIRNMSDEDIVKRVKEQADKINATIDQYNRVKDALSVRLPVDMDKKVLDELVFTAMQIQNFEKRFLTMLDETIEALNPVLQMGKYTTRTGENIATEEGQEARLEEMKTALRMAFSAYALPIKVPAKVAASTLKQLSNLKEIVKKNGGKELEDKVDDMLKLSRDRAAYYEKFEDLQTARGMAKFKEQAISQDDVNKKADEEFSKIETQGLQSVDDVRKAYLEKHDERDKLTYKDSLRKAAKSNPIAKQAIDLIDTYEAFKIFADRRGYGVGLNSIASDLPASGSLNRTHLLSMIDTLFRNANSAAEFISVADSLLPSSADWINASGQFMGMGYDLSHYDAAKEIVRRLMDAYVKANNITSTRTMPSTPVEHSHENETREDTGTEPAQPSSLNPAPSPKTETKVPEAEKEEKPDIAPEPEPKTVAEEEGLTPMSQNPDEDEIVGEADDAAQEPVAIEALAEEEIEQRDESKLTYYDLGVPEVDVEENEKARAGGQSRREANLAPFYTLPEHMSKTGVKVTPANYEKIWKKIDEEGGFDTTATEASVGDEVELIAYQKTTGDVSFPRHNNREPEIVLRLKRTGQILNTLPARTSKFYNLLELRRAFMDEYNAWRDTRPGADEVFVFSKTTRIWAKRKGQIDYAYGKEGDKFENEKPVNQVPGFNSDAPIVFIDKNGQPQIVSGQKKQGVPFDWGDRSLQSKKGNLYYMVPNGNDSYIPIRLFVEHFTPDNMNDDNPVFNKIRESITKIGNLVQMTVKPGFDKTLIPAVNKRLHEELANLVPLIDLNHVYMQVGDYPKVGMALRIVTNVGVQGIEEKSDPIDASKITPETLMRIIADMRPSLQIGSKKGMSFKDYIDNGFITTNARMMRPKGVDLYLDAWDGEKFTKITPGQAVYASAQTEDSSVHNPMASPDIPVESTVQSGATEQPGPPPTLGFEDIFGSIGMNIEGDAGAIGAMEMAVDYSENPVEPVGTEALPTAFDAIESDSVKEAILKDMTKEDFNSRSAEEQQKVIACHGGNQS